MQFALLRKLFTITNIFTLVCTGLTGFLLIKVFINYSITRPTSTSLRFVELDRSTFPDIVVCLQPPFNKAALKEFGYTQTSYFRGVSNKDVFIGWNGVEGKQNSTHILNSLMDGRLNDDFFDQVKYIDEMEKSTIVPSQFRTLLFPYGRCLLMKPTEFQTSFKNVLLHSNSANSTLGDCLDVFFMDPINSPLMFPMHFQMLGDKIEIPLKDLKNKNSYVTRISRSYHVEGDPAFDCKEYNKDLS